MRNIYAICIVSLILLGLLAAVFTKPTETEVVNGASVNITSTLSRLESIEVALKNAPSHRDLLLEKGILLVELNRTLEAKQVSDSLSTTSPNDVYVIAFQQLVNSLLP